MTYRKLDRREILKHAAMAALIGPVMRATMARAADPPVRRLVVVFQPNGLTYVDAGPNGGETSWDVGDHFRPYDRHKSDLLAFSGMHIGGIQFGVNQETGHAAGARGCLTCMPDGGNDFATGPSIDQFVARKLFEQRLAPYVKAPVFAVGGNGADPANHWQPWYESSGRKAAITLSPRAAFDGLFAGFTASTGTTIDRVVARRKSILDLAYADCKAMLPALPAEGRELVDYHCARIREVEQSLDAMRPGGPSCEVPDAALGAVQGRDIYNPSSYPALASFFFKLIDAGLRCDLTRVAGLEFGYAATRFNMPWVNAPLIGEVGTGEYNVNDHHSYHHVGNREVLGRFMNWYAEQIATFVDLLKVPGPDGTRLLDSTMVHVTNEFGGDGTPSNHYNGNVPMFVFGGGGAFRTGRHLRFDNDGKHHHALMVSLIRGMGITGVDQFGHPAGGSGPLARMY